MNEIKSKLRKLRLIQLLILLFLLISAAFAEFAFNKIAGRWTWRRWLITGLAVYAVFEGFYLRRRFRLRFEQLLGKGADHGKALRQWEAGQLVSLVMGASVAFWGVVIRMVFHGATWQALLFFVTGLFFVLLWTPRMPMLPDQRSQKS